MKRLAGLLVAAAVVLAGGVAVAQGNAPTQGGNSAGAMKKFQKETLSLRDELGAKRVDLQAEYDKDEPDAARIASLRKDIVDLEAKIQAVSERYGIRTGRARGRAYGSDGHGWDRGGWDGYGWDGYGPGCGCW